MHCIHPEGMQCTPSALGVQAQERSRCSEDKSSCHSLLIHGRQERSRSQNSAHVGRGLLLHNPAKCVSEKLAMVWELRGFPALAECKGLRYPPSAPCAAPKSASPSRPGR